jgi:hypothetical protein
MTPDRFGQWAIRGRIWMRRFVVVVVAAMALVATVAILPAQGATGGPKPPKLDPPTIDGGTAYPVGLAGKYGVIQVSWPTPAASFAITGYTVTCTPKYFKPAEGNTLTTTPIIVTVTLGPPVTVVSDNGAAAGASDYSTVGGATPMTKLKVHEVSAGADTVYPSRVCAVTTTNAQGSKAGKAGKVGIASTPNCSLIPQPDQEAPDYTDPKKPIIKAGVEVTSLGNLLFCSTDPLTGKAAWNSDQGVQFSSKSKFKRDKKTPLIGGVACGKVNLIACNSFATISKLGLVSKVNTALTLDISGTDLRYEYDATQVTATSCVMTKPNATDSCTIMPVVGGVGTIRMTSTQLLEIKPGKAIKSPTIDITFNTTGKAAGTYPIWLKSATTTISILGNAIDIVLKSMPQIVTEQAVTLHNTYGCTSGPSPAVGCHDPNPAAFGGTDLNYGPAAPIASFTVTP